MVTLHYGVSDLKINKNNLFLSPSDQKILLNGGFVLETGIPYDANVKIRKAYYVGILWELFKENYSEFSNMEIYGMMIIAYPIFMEKRQIQNVIAEYYKLKSENDVLA